MEGDDSIILTRTEPLRINAPGDHKNWLADSVNKHHQSAARLARIDGLRPKTVSEWAYRKRQGVILKEEVGRPRVLDEMSFEKLLEYYSSNQDVEDSVLREKIRDELIETNLRRSLLSDRPAKCVKMSPRTLKRYVKRIRSDAW